MSWKDDGNCYGDPNPDMWFPKNPEDPLDPGPTLEVALAYVAPLCATCPVFDTCHREGKKTEYGIWAGQLRGV